MERKPRSEPRGRLSPGHCGHGEDRNEIMNSTATGVRVWREGGGGCSDGGGAESGRFQPVFFLPVFAMEELEGRRNENYAKWRPPGDWPVSDSAPVHRTATTARRRRAAVSTCLLFVCSVFWCVFFFCCCC